MQKAFYLHKIMENNHRYKKIVIEIIILTMVIFITVDVVFALKNPSVVYCEEMGYEFAIEETERGQIGICKFSETEKCPAWDFLTGKCGEEYSYCSKEGYQLKTIKNLEKCLSIPFSSECAVCILGDGREVEVTKLMGLSFEEGICGDGKCILGENYKTCSQDCPSGSSDFYCDGVLDGRCDPDCEPDDDLDCRCGDGVCEEKETPENCCLDCGCPVGMKCLENKCIEEAKVLKEIEEEKETPAVELAAAKRKLYYLLGGIVILLAIGVGIYFYWRKKWLS